jgi:hypothetical protein
MRGPGWAAVGNYQWFKGDTRSLVLTKIPRQWREKHVALERQTVSRIRKLEVLLTG